MLPREFPAVEGRKLKDHRTQLWAENIHRVHKFVEFRIAINERFFVSNDLRNFNGESEIVRSSSGPIADRASRGTSVERRVNFDRSKARGVIGEIVGGFHPSRIEGTCPAIGGERRSAEENSGQRISAVNGERAWCSRLLQFLHLEKGWVANWFGTLWIHCSTSLALTSSKWQSGIPVNRGGRLHNSAFQTIRNSSTTPRKTMRGENGGGNGWRPVFIITADYQN